MYKIYSKDACPNCDQAVKLATSKGVKFSILKLDKDYTREGLWELVPTARAVPQIFRGDELIGDLAAFSKHLAST